MNAADLLISKAEDRSATFAVVGLGYAGLPLAVELATSGYGVIGLDVAKAVVDGINMGVSHIRDVPSGRLAQLVRDGKIEATLDRARISEVDAVAICVPTPLS